MVDKVVGDLHKDVVLTTFGTILIVPIVLNELLEEDVYNLYSTLLILLPKGLG